MFFFVGGNSKRGRRGFRNFLGKSAGLLDRTNAPAAIGSLDNATTLFALHNCLDSKLQEKLCDNRP